MSDLFVLAVMASVALSCGLTVAFLDHLKPSDEPLSDDAYGDVPAIPEDFKVLHSACVTEGGQPNNGAR